MGMLEPEGMSLLSYYQTVQVAAREAGILPIGYPGSIAEFTDLDLFRSNAMVARRLGFDGGACIHPRQVPISMRHSPQRRRNQSRGGHGESLRRGNGCRGWCGRF